MNELLVPSADLEKDIDRYRRMGYRMDMIMPADAPREALLSANGEVLRLVSEVGRPEADSDQAELGTGGDSWIIGRAGMEYLDLIPGRFSGNLIASRIRLTKGGEVPDQVHYHKVRFQMIYCLKGAIKVVYEDQGEPFWLNPGDCVLQPPEIRHRVLECTAGSEVLEVSMPAVHETWIEHRMELPTHEVNPERDFGGQRFCRHIASNVEWQTDSDFDFRDTGIEVATGGFADVRVFKMNSEKVFMAGPHDDRIMFCVVLEGRVTFSSRLKAFTKGEGFTLNRDDEAHASAGSQLVYVSIKT